MSRKFCGGRSTLKMSRSMNRPTPSLAVIRLAVLCVLLVTAGIAILFVGTDGVTGALDDAAESRWGIAAFFVIYVVAVVTLVPGTVGSVASGAMLGFGVGLPVSLAGALTGATIAFFISQQLGREGSQQLLGDRLSSIDHWVGDNDFVSIVTLRLMPIVPFNLLNYAAGLSAMRPSRYIAGTSVGMIPGTALTVFAASRANDPSSNAFRLAAAALLATVFVSTYVARRATRTRSVPYDP
jgi:uncharacterized membrane protein YdjX (TVP38/TMEM64 family)